MTYTTERKMKEERVEGNIQKKFICEWRRKEVSVRNKKQAQLKEQLTTD